MNNCVFLGRITKDLESKKVGNDNTTIINFTLAVNRKFKKDGQPEADFLNMVVMGKTAEIMEKYCEKGSQIAVTSRVQTRSWNDKDGKKHFATEFVVESFDFAGGNKTSNNSNNNSSSADDDEFEL